MTAQTLWRLAYRAARSGYGLEWCREHCPAMLTLADKVRS